MSKIDFESEYILHKLTQNHLKDLFDLEFVASEIQLNKLRLDNLAFDVKTGSFVIIEYKNEYNENVLNQAEDYHNLILENREFFLKRLENPKDVDFKTTRIMIIGPKFSEAQIRKTKSNCELWKISLFDEGRVEYENLKTNEVKTLDIDLKDLELTEEMLLENKSDEMKDLYLNLKNRVLDEFKDIKIKYLVNAFSFRVNDNIICVIKFLKSSFNIYINGENLKNSEKATDNTTGPEVGNYKLKYKSDDDLDYFMNLFKQTYLQKRE